MSERLLNKFINTYLPFVNLTIRRQKTARSWHLPNFISIVNICGLLSIFRAIPSNHHRSCLLSISHISQNFLLCYVIWLLMSLIANKLRSETKETTLRVGHFTTGSGHIYANYINNFHKTEDLTVILTCTTLKNLH